MVLNFFVLNLRELDNEKDRQEAFDIIANQYDDIIRRQFQLAYFSNIPISDTDNMDIYEFKVIYKIMLDQIELEKNQIEGMKN